ncbi:MAG: C4-type zinc ribbon domain-containing protein [Candidatus Omnitrophota bacterium]|nr:C4-type zinc ribbon domain-containing protein [Candidatus Omnitrophota bacterium]
MNLKEEIKKLAQLQETDSKIYSLRKEKEVILPQRLEKIKNEFEDKKKGLQDFENQAKQLLLKKREKELDLATKEEGVKKTQGQLYQLKSNKEYQIKLTEIASLKADVSILEEEVIKALDEIENVDKKLKEAKTFLSQEEKKFSEEDEKLNNRIKDIDAEIKSLDDRRNVLIKDIDGNVLSRYEKLLNTRSGLAIVPVDVDSENCSACNMRVTPQTINEIKMYKNLVLCESCVRILYIAEDVVV